MRLCISLNERDASTFKTLGGSKWLQRAISRARALHERQAADEAVCEYLERFSDEEIRDSIAGVEQTVDFEHEGKSFCAVFFIASDDLRDREGQSLANAVERVIRKMRVEIQEKMPF